MRFSYSEFLLIKNGSFKNSKSNVTHSKRSKSNPLLMQRDGEKLLKMAHGNVLYFCYLFDFILDFFT